MEIPLLFDERLENCLRRHSIKEVFVCGRQTERPVNSHVVGFPRLEIPLKGSYENQLEYNGQVETVCLRPGAVLFAPPDSWNLPTWRLNVELISILFGQNNLGVSLVNNGPVSSRLTAQKFSTQFPLTGPLPHIINAMAELQIAGKPGEAFTGLAYALIQCVRDLLRSPADNSIHKAHNLLESVCVFLQSHYQFEVTRDSIASEFKITPNHLSRLFQTQGNMTFKNYLNHVRINRGKHLLCNYDLKLGDVATQCGFRDIAYFCHVFKRTTKITPAEFRSNYRLKRVKRDLLLARPAFSSSPAGNRETLN